MILRFLRGLTLIELMIAAGILVFCLCGILLTYVQMFILSDLSRDFTLAINAIQAKMEEIKRKDFDSLSLGGQSFNLTDYGFPYSESKGRMEISNTTYSDLRRVRLVGSFKSRQRIIGEDKDFDGILDTGEDTNSNGRLDSPLELVTLIAR